MHIGQALTSLATGGATRAVVGLAEGLRDLGHQTTVYAYHVPTEVRHRLGKGVVSGAGSERPPMLPIVLPGRSTSLERRVMRRLDSTDALLLTGMFVPSNARMAALSNGRTLRIANPLDPYSTAVFASREAVKTAYWRTVERRYLSGCDGVAVMVEGHAQELHHRGVNRPSLLCPGGLSAHDLDGARQSLERRAHGWPADHKPRVGFLGRWDIHKKGLDLLLEAMRGSPGAAAELVLAGPGTIEQANETRALVRSLDLDSAVRLEGPVNDIWEFLVDLDLLVLPSRVEGFGLVVIEALAAGVPVLATRTCGVAQALGPDAAVVWAEPTAPSLRRGLEDALSRLDELTGHAINTASAIATQFSWRANAESLVNRLQCL